ncbi:MAG: hypothetical protein WDN24_10780 [Sphingomonas sp.]
MTRTLILTNGVAVLVGGLGAALLIRPAAARALLRIADSEQAAYGLRILGAMLFAAALFLGGFGTAFWLASAA